MLLRLPMFDERLPYATHTRRNFNLAGLTFIAFMNFAGLSIMAVEIPARQMLFQFGLMSVAAIWVVCHGVAMIWWRKNIRFCELGIVWDRRVLLWTHLIEQHWKDSDANVFELKGIDQNNLDFHLLVAVPVELRQVLDELTLAQVHQSERTLHAIEHHAAPVTKSFLERHALRIDHFLGVLLCCPAVCSISVGSEQRSALRPEFLSKAQLPR